MNVFDLAAKLTLDTSDFDKGLKAAGSTIKRVGKAFGTALTAATAGVTVLTKSAVDAYADYEQLVGGVETLFGNGGKSIQQYAKDTKRAVKDVSKEYASHERAQARMMKNAREAYKTAGLSANQYMETATSFAASMIASLGGDTEKAVDYTNRAVLQMSDNANKMGTDIGAIQAAYTGFSKQNYTMLDNLKLGYGGTKTEMERLIKDAEKLDSSFKATRDSNGKLSMSYADIVDAIQIVQDNMGITGTTAKEAASTISGSLSMMRASWQNLLTAMAAGNGFKEQMDALVNSASTALGNIIPVVKNFLVGFGDLMKQVGPIIVDKLPQIIQDVVPSILDAAVAIVGALVDALPGILGAIVTVVSSLVDTISAELNARWPVIGEAFDTVVELFKSGFEAVAGFWENTLKPALSDFWAYVTETLAPAMQEAWNTTIGPAITGVFNKVATFWNETLKPALSAFWEFVVGTVAPAMQEAWTNTIKPAIVGAFTSIATFWTETLQPALSAFWEFVTTTLAPAIVEAWTNTIKPAIVGAFEAISNFWTSTLQPVFSSIWGWLSNTLGPAFDLVAGAINGDKDAMSKLNDILNIALPIIGGLAAAILAYNIVVKAMEGVSLAAAIAQKAMAAAQLVLNAIMSANPIALVVAALAGLAAAFAIAWNRSEKFREVVTGAWEAVKSGVISLKDKIVEAWNTVKTKTSEIWNAITDFIPEAWNTIKTSVQNAVMSVRTSIGNAWNAIKTATETLWSAILAFISNTWTTIKANVQDAVMALRTSLGNTWNAIQTTIETVWSAISTWLSNTWTTIKTNVTNAVTSVRTTLGNTWNAIKSTVETVWNAISSWISTTWNTIKTNVQNAVTSVQTTLGNVWNSIKTRTENVWESIKQGISDKWTAIKSGVQDAVISVQTRVGNTWNTIKTSTANIWDSIKKSITDKIENARDKVKDAIDKVKSFLNFEWKWPKIPLPHFSITGSANPFDWIGNPGKIPSLSVSWYARAMRNGMILTDPTIFGMMNGNLLGGGEAGPEAVVGVSSLNDMIQSSVTRAVGQTQTAILGVLLEILKAIPKGELVLDTGALVAAIGEDMNAELEQIAAWTGGGRA